MNMTPPSITLHVAPKSEAHAYQLIRCAVKRRKRWLQRLIGRRLNQRDLHFGRLCNQVSDCDLFLRYTRIHINPHNRSNNT